MTFCSLEFSEILTSRLGFLELKDSPSILERRKVRLSLIHLRKSIAIVLIQGCLALSCKPGDAQVASSRSGKANSYAAPQDQQVEDPLLEEVADTSIPVSGTNLTFRIGKNVVLSSVDAYVVGFVDKLIPQQVNDQEFQITGIPAGSREIIVTGLSTQDTPVNVSYDRGLRFPIEAQEGLLLDVGVVDLPKTGGLSGLVEMEGISGFSTVTLDFPGTKIPAVTPNSLGRYEVTSLPVGIHNLKWLQKDNPISGSNSAKVESASITLKSSRDLVRSIPNRPSNLRIQSAQQAVAMSWISGGGNATGYLVYRSTGTDTFTPKNGQTYGPGALGQGLIVASGTMLSAKDTAVAAGTTYTYKVFAFNQDRVYSAPVSEIVTVSALTNAYRKYRLYIDSVANNCQTEGTAQIQALNFYIDNVWQTNDFTSNTNQGRIGSYPVTVSVNNMYNTAYDAFYAFQDDNLAWSSSFKSYAQTSPFDVLSNKSPAGIYFEMDFGSTAVNIGGLEILGGEPPFFPECSPDSYRMVGSDDGTTWVAIPGSARQENTQTRLRYYFQNENRPLSPLRFKLLGNEGQVQLSWESPAATEVGYLLVRSRMPQPFAAENGKTYGVGSAEAGYEILVDSNVLSYSDLNFEDLHTAYYYTLLSYDGSRQYSSPIIGRASPEKREAYRYYRFVVLSILGGGPNMSWMDSLKLQVNGTWIDQYLFTGMTGTIGSTSVVLSQSSANGLNSASGLFGAGYWQTVKPSFSSDGMNDALKASGEFVQIDFGSQPSAVTGFRAFGNTALDSNNRYSSPMYYQVPDVVRMERSQDGLHWEVIEGSQSTDSLAQEIEAVW